MMNILFLTLVQFESIQERSIYTDLLRELVKQGHEVYAISPVERRQKQETHVVREHHSTILRLRIGNTQKTNVIEKGISTVRIEPLYKKAIQKYFSNVRFDLVLYSTPPITLVSAIEYVKKRDDAKTYLMLKDIFPQNAIDIGLMSLKGPKGILYKHFRKQEKKLYAISDRIGCMSPANMEYVLDHNPGINRNRVEVSPNCVEIIDKSVDDSTRCRIREKYRIPQDKTAFIYGGNLGKPQDVPFIIECLKTCAGLDSAHFLIVGNGTDYHLIDEYAQSSGQENLTVMRLLPKEDYDTMVGACDIGLIFLDHRFTIPNFPSRLLSYLQAKLPVLTVTDHATDVGAVVEDNAFGVACFSDDVNSFRNGVEQMLSSDLGQMGMRGYLYLSENYNVLDQAKQIVRSVQ